MRVTDPLNQRKAETGAVLLISNKGSEDLSLNFRRTLRAVVSDPVDGFFFF